MGKGRQTTTQNTISEPWRAAQPTLNRGLDRLNEIYDSGNLQPAPFGPMLASESPYSVQARHDVASQALAGNPVVAPTQAAYADMVGGDPYQKLDAVKQSALRSALPAAAQNFQNAGMLNSSIAGQGMAEAAARAVAPIEYGAHQQSENRRLSAMSMAPQIADLAYHDSRMLDQAGNAEMARLQAEIDDAARNYYEMEDRDYNELQRLSQMAMGYGGMGGTSSGTMTSSRSSGLAGILGGLTQLGGLGLQAYTAFSDRRLKENIQKIGETEVSVPVYRYNYKGDDVPQVGVMSDEVPMSMVSKHPSGYDMVDYRKVLS